MKLEFRIPISPRPGFFAQVRLYALSLQRLGPPYSQARIVVAMGDRADAAAAALANPWSAALPIRWYAVEHHWCEAMPHAASGLGRYMLPSDADVIVLCDADTCPIARFDELVSRLRASDAPLVAGLQAHYSPFYGLDNDAVWRSLLDREGLAHVPLTQPYSMDVRGEQGSAPPYFNYGFVAFNAAAFAALSPVMARAVGLMLGSFPGNRFFAQLALALTIASENVGTIALGHEYNCANDDVLLRHGRIDIADIRIVHYLRTEEIDRTTFLQDEHFDAFVSRPKANPISERFRAHVASLDWTFGEPSRDS